MLKYKIALVGKANSGKNTLANLLGANLSQYYRSIAFADPIKEMVLTMFPAADKECLFGPSNLRSNPIPGAFKDGNPLTYRDCLIDLGELGRKYNPDIWIERLDERLSKIKNFVGTEGVETVVVSDTRRLNEAQFLKMNNFFFIKINRDLSLKLNHTTETDQDGIKDSYFDYILNNNGTMDELRANVFDIVSLIKNKFE